MVEHAASPAEMLFDWDSARDITFEKRDDCTPWARRLGGPRTDAEEVLIGGLPVTLKRPYESIKYLGVLINMNQDWSDQVQSMNEKIRINGARLSAAKLAYTHKSVVEVQKILAGARYALPIIQPCKTLSNEIITARTAVIRKLAGLTKSTDRFFAYLQKQRGGLGAQALEPLYSQLSAEALVADLNDEGCVGRLTRSLTMAQLAHKKADSLAAADDTWIRNVKCPSLSRSQAARSARNGLRVQ